MENLFEWINNMLDTHPVVTASINKMFDTHPVVTASINKMFDTHPVVTASIAIAIAHYNMVMDGVGGVLGS
jgi:hypothetical protein